MSVNTSMISGDSFEDLGEFRWIVWFVAIEVGMVVLAVLSDTVINAPVIAGLIGTVVVMSVVTVAVLLVVVGLLRLLT